MTGFLELADAVLLEGAASLVPSFRQKTLAYVCAAQRRDGAFATPSPALAPDLYYTDFGVRLLCLLSDDGARVELAARWAECRPCQTIIDCFNRLNIGRLAAGRGVAMAALRLPELPGGEGAYELFLRWLAGEMLGEPKTPRREQLLQLQRGDGGFAESPQGLHSQTNATAAILPLLWQAEEQGERVARGCDYLAARQTPCGGFAAHAGAPADLLSTFSALLALGTLGRLEESVVNLAAAASFLRRCARSDGGFAADQHPPSQSDVEYTYYGVATACLLRRIADSG